MKKRDLEDQIEKLETRLDILEERIKIPCDKCGEMVSPYYTKRHYGLSKECNPFIMCYKCHEELGKPINRNKEGE